MFDVFALLGDLSPAIKLGWIVFAAWSAAQVLWFRRARLAEAASVKPVRKRKSQSSTRRPVARVPHRPPAEAENSAELLASLGIIQSPGASQYGVPMSSNQMGPTVIS
jgi:hypothetical protein